MADILRADVVTQDLYEGKIRCIERALEKNRENTPKESHNVYYGLDNMALYNRFHRGQFILADVVFTLRKVLWEGEMFWIPNDAEEFITYEYENPWDFPDDVGIPLHL